MTAPSNEEPLCKKCGKTIPKWAPSGNCPACLFGSGKSEDKPQPPPEETTREKIGDWELQEQIGEGAFGVVFAAEQSSPVRRSAALKILRPGMGSKETIARFQAESQALALLNHPDIVTVYDAGNTDDGRPFFAMEFVPGDTVTRFASSFSLQEKLALFDRICAVVEHAHRRGIIHRDLKPGNILAYKKEDGETVVKLLDFGIAKATDQILTESTILTGSGNFLGTPEYMSPEQSSESDIDIRADVYSLGVILFELLAGRPPFVLKSHSLDAVMRFLNQIQDDDPPTLSSIATESVTNDLEWIVSKTIEKDRDRRYRTVSELRDDLRRFQRNEPVEARPRDTFYIAGKFIRRNWKFTAAVGAIFLSIVSAAIISGIMAAKANDAARETSRAFSISDMRSAVGELDRRNYSKAISHLTQSLTTDPTNVEAAMLLQSTIKQFPISKMVLESDLQDNRLRIAHFVDDNGNSAIISEAGSLQFLDSDGKIRAPTIGTPGTNHYSALSPNQDQLVVTNIQGEFLLIDLETNQRLPLEQVKFDDKQRFSEIAFSPDGESLCIGSRGGDAYLWESATGKIRWKRQILPGVQSLVFSANGKQVSVATLEGKVIDLDSVSGKPIKEHPASTEPIRKLVDSGSGYRYYTVSSSGIIAAVDAGRVPRTFTEERVQMPLLFTVVDPKRRLVAYAGESEVSIWTVEGRTIIKRLRIPNQPTSVKIHPHENIAFIATKDSGIHIWDFENDREIGTQIRRAKHVDVMHIDAERNLLHTISRDGVLRIFEFPVLEAEPAKLKILPDEWDKLPIQFHNEHFVRGGALNLRSLEEIPPEFPRTIGLSADRKNLFTTFRDGFIRLWNLETGELEDQVKMDTTSSRSCDLSPDGTLLAFRDRFSTIALYDLRTKTKTPFTSRHQRDLSSIVFSPSGETLAVATDGGSLDIYDVTTGETTIPRVQHYVRGLVAPHFCQFSSDGTIIASWGEADSQFRFWNTATGAIAASPINTSGIPRFGCFLEGDETFATVSEDGDNLYLQLWSISQTLPVTPRRKIRSEALSPRDFQLPDKTVFTAEQLQDIKRLNGLTVGKNGHSDFLTN